MIGCNKTGARTVCANDLYFLDSLHNFMIFLLCILDLEKQREWKIEFRYLLVSSILIFKLILICKFQNVPCALVLK